MENLLYYTFSTTAQSLAALGALFSVYWVYFMPLLSDKMRTKCRGALKELDRDELDNRSYQNALFSGLENHLTFGTNYGRTLSKNIDWSIGQNDFRAVNKYFSEMQTVHCSLKVHDAILYLESIDNKRKKLTDSVKLALIFAAVQIFACVVTLSCVLLVQENERVAIALLVSNGIATAYFLYVVMKAIVDSMTGLEQYITPAANR